ncbi:hypothetical protein IFM12276_65880 [Nocardia sputorum]|uniref:Uncharacterized protein n=1 Tax=Nocardia sputorum TaxID=2984338 RepID=A0ABN6UF06_9NOCA|nr:hypothetical protein IFM12276_65880 [Nocardia sputorum]
MRSVTVEFAVRHSVAYAAVPDREWYMVAAFAEKRSHGVPLVRRAGAQVVEDSLAKRPSHSGVSASSLFSALAPK